MFVPLFDSTLEEAEIVLVGFPLEEGSDKKGYKEIPKKIRESFDEIYYPLRNRLPKVYDHGDIDLDMPLPKALDKIYETVLYFKSLGKKVYSLGGNHLISYPIIKALEPRELIIFDSHPDCFYGDLNYATWVRYIIEEGIIKPNKIALVGINNWAKDEKEFLDSYNIKYYDSIDVFFDLDNVIQELKKFKNPYVSLDFDGFIDKGVWREPLGIMPHHYLRIIYSLENIYGFDLVEAKDYKLAGRILLESF